MYSWIIFYQRDQSQLRCFSSFTNVKEHEWIYAVPSLWGWGKGRRGRPPKIALANPNSCRQVCCVLYLLELFSTKKIQHLLTYHLESKINLNFSLIMMQLRYEICISSYSLLLNYLQSPVPERGKVEEPHTLGRLLRPLLPLHTEMYRCTASPGFPLPLCVCVCVCVVGVGAPFYFLLLF